MKRIMAWVDGGGAPPWRGLTAAAAELALSVVGNDHTAALSLARKLKTTFTWAAFLKLDASWARVEAIQRLCHAGALLKLDGFERVQVLSDEVYESLSGQADASRGLALGLSHLKTKSSLRKWQERALDRAGLGTAGFKSKLTKERLEKRRLSVVNLEKRCEENISRSLELSPVWTKNKSHLHGLPSWLISEARERAKAKRWSGWLFSANYREYATFMENARSRDMRRLMYQARSKAGSEYVAGCDNAMLAKKILSSRRSAAKEDGYASYADYILSDNMLQKPSEVEGMLLECARNATPHASVERAELDGWMKAQHGVARLEPWDYRFARAALLSELAGNTFADAEKYFTPIGTIERCVQAAAKFLGVKARRRSEQEIDDLMVFEVCAEKSFKGFITIVPKARVLKSDLVAFEWSLATRSENRKIEPSSMVFLQMETVSGRLVNFRHRNVWALLHELGHAFHAVLGQGRFSADSPSGIEADAMEMPSQLLEMLAWDAKVLTEIGVCKGRRMPEKMAETLSLFRNFHSGAWTISQVTDALCDLRLHTDFNPRGRLMPWEIMVAIKGEVGLDKAKSYNRQAQQLGTFTGSYVCSDYCYLWSEGLAYKVYQKWKGDAALLRSERLASERMRRAFFEQGARLSMKSQMNRYIGETPACDWISQSREF